MIKLIMKKVRSITFFLILLAGFLFYLPILQKSFAQICVVTQIGNEAGNQPTLPPGCTSVVASGSGTTTGPITPAGPIALKAVQLAQAQIGKAYILGSPNRNWAGEDPSKGKTPAHFDCSGLTGWSYYWASGGFVNMQGQTWADWSRQKDRNGTSYLKFPYKKGTSLQDVLKQLQPGDLLYFQYPGGNDKIVHHTAIFSGKCLKSSSTDCFIQAPHTGAYVEESHFTKGYITGSMPFLGSMRPGPKGAN